MLSYLFDINNKTDDFINIAKSQIILNFIKIFKMHYLIFQFFFFIYKVRFSKFVETESNTTQIAVFSCNKIIK